MGAVLIALASCALAGCTGGPAADPGASSSPAPASEPSPALEPPVAEPAKPDGWADSGADGAAAAAVWFLSDEYRYVIETNDTTEWERLSHPECVFCASLTADAQVMVEGGRTSQQDRANEVYVTRVEELNPLAYAVLVDIDQATVLDFDNTGALVHESEGGPAQLLLVLHREGPDWQLREGEGFEADADVPSALG